MSESQPGPLFDINKCQAKMQGAGDLVDCLAPQQAPFCGHSLPFGFGYFCQHPAKKEFVERAIKLQGGSVARSSSDTQE